MTEYKVHPYCDICAKDFQDAVDKLKAENDRLKSDAEQNELILLALHEALKEKQARVQELESVNEDQALTISQNDYAYAVDKEMMEAEIKESNGLLRSAFMIAKRDGKETNWEAWRKQLEIALTRQHKMMYGEKAQQALNEVTK
jgi:hypothetical protein